MSPESSSGYALSRIREEPILFQLYTYWEAARGAKDVPDRRDIDPTAMPPFILPHLAMIEIHDGPRLRLRLVGTEIVRQHRRDNTGRFCDEFVDGPYLDYLNSLYLQIQRSRLPVFSESVFRHVDTHLSTSRLILPLTMGGSEIRIGLLGQLFKYTGNHPTPVIVPLEARSLEIINRITLEPTGTAG
jgi:hypothetical protein